VLAEPPVVRDSALVPPAVPGHGMRWDEEAVKRYAI